jgi:2,3-diaminopropionate biosynthesis protein SbnB
LIYLAEKDILALNPGWPKYISTIRKATIALQDGNFVQPVKPYLRYKNPVNRIIAMPAYLGTGFELAGIKWIASFPDNLKKGMPRAHSVTILNEADTGQPVAIINTSLVSGIRTAAVSGLVVEEYLHHTSRGNINVGIIGAGPIGQLHLAMLLEQYADRIANLLVYDSSSEAKMNLPPQFLSKVRWCASWEDTYTDADIFITCTTAPKRYINLPPKKGSLQLNVSLRDYQVQVFDHVALTIVDSWEEVCRENTDIESANKQGKLNKEDVCSLTDFITGNRIKACKADDVIMFNPMGMAAFDIAIGSLFYTLASSSRCGTFLD